MRPMHLNLIGQHLDSHYRARLVRLTMILDPAMNGWWRVVFA